MKQHSLALGITLVTVTACSGSGGNGELEFRAEQPVLPGFELDTGLQPAESQGQVRAVARATGSLVASAAASANGETLEPTAGSGQLTLQAEIGIEVFAKLAVGALNFDEKVGDVAISAPAAEVSFEPFLLGETTTVTSTLEPAELMSVPLGALPGSSLVVSLVGGSLEASFAGECATIVGGAAQYRGAVTWGGSIELAATIEVEVPLTGTSSFGPFAVEIPIAAFETPLDLGVRDVATGDEMMPAIAPCDASGDGPDDGDSGDGGDTGGDGDGGGGDGSGGDGDPDDQEVEPLPSSLWSVEIVSAHVAVIPCDGMEWDPDGGAPDPKVAVSTPEGQWSWTDFKSDTFDPVYDEKVGTWEYQELRTPEFPTTFLVYEADPGGAQKYVGITGSFYLQPDQFDGAAHEVVRERNCALDQAGMSVRFRLVAED